MTKQANNQALDVILSYHQRTKHHFDRYAPGPGYLDWATQPEPFRFYQGAPRFSLSRREPARTEPPRYDELYGRLLSSPVNPETLSTLLFHSFSLSAWKEAGDSRWSLRCNPSSGNLHPTEVYLLSGPVPGLMESATLTHYNSYFHGLELRGEFPGDLWHQILSGLPPGILVVGFTSIHWRESWKYGERALRYCLLDLGHAYAALAYSAACLGWACALLPEVDTVKLAHLLGVADQQAPEAEHPDCLVAVFPDGKVDWETVSHWQLPEGTVEQMQSHWVKGLPNRLSPSHRPWPIIEHAAHALHSQRIDVGPVPQLNLDETVDPRPIGARWLIRHRRSVQTMDGSTEIRQADFIRLLYRLSRIGLPVSGLGCGPGIHLGFFVHQVEALSPGLYFLARSKEGMARFRETSAEDWEWSRLWEDIPFYRLREGDAGAIAKAVSCHQDIASDGAFALSMLAEFEPRLQQSVWEYVRLHMEAGALGQLLYLEAEAAGLRGTGIGCFFDDPVHELFGLAGRTFQVLYHFTVGGGLEDERLSTLDAYHHLEKT